MKYSIVMAAFWSALGVVGIAQIPATTGTQPADTAQGAGETKAQAAPAPAVDPAVRKILDSLEAAGAKHTTIRADVVYEIINITLGDSEKRTGWVCYQKEKTVTRKNKKHTEPAKMRFHFATLQQGKGPIRANKVDYALDREFFTEAKETLKTVTRYQLPPRSNQQQEPELMKIGKGPFPLPFGQKTADMIRYFDCTTRPVRQYDPKGSVYLKLVPRKEYSKEFNFHYIQMWIDRKTYLPVKVVSRDKAKNITTVTFANVETDLKFEGKLFLIPKPPGWKLIVVLLEPGTNLRP
ncbi:MAG: outer membrane lipoprotein carrier protein LolA [Phycisphaerae bacterium]|jgi:hypothetical protein|nr:outer membrane lipoprotein carrier protein LolA [Phycisphaerae bacterium]